MRAVAPGLAWTASVALLAWLLSHVVPLLGAPVLAILLGLVLATVRRPAESAQPGIAFSSTVLLQVAIVLLGTGLGLGQILRVGARSLPVMLGTLAVALALAYAAGRLLAVSPRMRTLVGVGTGICGASAIAAVSRVIGATSTEITYAISAIFLFNVAAVVLFPVVGHLLHMSQHGFGLWAGTAVNDTSSVVAVGYAFGSSAGAQAVVVKLTRTTLIVPIVLALSAWHARSAPGDALAATRPRRLVPPFLALFVLAAALNTAGAIGAGLHRPLSDAALALTTVALAGVGLSSDFGAMRRTGLRPVVLAAILWVAVACVSLLLQAATNQS